MALTDTRLRNLRPTGKRFELQDRDGLTLRVSQKGKMTWSLSFRMRGAGDVEGVRVDKVAGGKQRLTLGDYPTLTLADAREKAHQAKRMARAGVLPADSYAAPVPALQTVEGLFDKFTIEHLLRNNQSGNNVVLLLRRHLLPAWRNREAQSISRSDLIQLLERVRVARQINVIDTTGRSHQSLRGGPGAAAELRKWATAMFQFGVESGVLATNPFSGVRNRDKQIRRDHVLTMDELRTVWRAAGALSYPWGPFFQLLMLTGDRRGEWANAKSGWLVDTA